MENSPLADPSAPKFLQKKARLILLGIGLMFLSVPVLVLLWQPKPKTIEENVTAPAEAATSNVNNLAAEEEQFKAAPSVPVAIDLSNRYASSRQFAACERVARMGLKLEPDNSILLNNLGFAQIELRQFGEAKKSLEKAIQLKPDFTLASNNLKWGLDEMSKVKKSLEERLANKTGSELDYYIGLGISYYELAEYEQSNSMFLKAGEVAPADPRPVNNIGLNYMFLGKYPEAINYFEKAVALAPAVQLYKNNLAWAKGELGK